MLLENVYWSRVDRSNKRNKLFEKKNTYCLVSTIKLALRTSIVIISMVELSHGLFPLEFSVCKSTSSKIFACQRFPITRTVKQALKTVWRSSTLVKAIFKGMNVWKIEQSFPISSEFKLNEGITRFR